MSAAADDVGRVSVRFTDSEFGDLEVTVPMSVTDFTEAARLIRAGEEDAAPVCRLQDLVRDAVRPEGRWGLADDLALRRLLDGGGDATGPPAGEASEVITMEQVSAAAAEAEAADYARAATARAFAFGAATQDAERLLNEATGAAVRAAARARMVWEAFREQDAPAVDDVAFGTLAEGGGLDA